MTEGGLRPAYWGQKENWKKIEMETMPVGWIWDQKPEKGGVLFGKVLGGGDEDFGGAAGGGLFADGDFDVVVEGGEEIHEAFDGEAVEAVVGECGNFGLVYVQTPRGPYLREPAIVKNAVDGNGQAHLGLFLIRPGKAKISKNVARAGNYIKSVFSSRHVAPRNAVVPSEAAEQLARCPLWMF